MSSLKKIEKTSFPEKQLSKSDKILHLNLPLNNNCEEWETVLYTGNNFKIIQNLANNHEFYIHSNNSYKHYAKAGLPIQPNQKYGLVEVKSNNKTLFTFEDHFFKSATNSDALPDSKKNNQFYIKRIFQNKEFYIQNEEIKLKTYNFKTDFLKKIKKKK